MKFGKRMKHTKWYQEILNIFMKNDFSHLWFRTGLTDKNMLDTDPVAEMDTDFQNRRENLRRRCRCLGQQLGQIANTRHDMLPVEITSELEKLQNEEEHFEVWESESEGYLGRGA